MTSSGRCVKRRNLDKDNGASSRTRRLKKQRIGRKTSKKKSLKAKSLRPQRVAARNALNFFSQITGAATDEDDSGSEEDSSESETMLQDSNIQSGEPDSNLSNAQLNDPKAEQASLLTSVGMVKPPEPLESQMNIGNKRRLVLKFSLRDSKKTVTPENTRPKIDSRADLACLSSPTQETSKENWVNLISRDPRSSSSNANITDAEPSENHNRTDFRDREPKKVEDHLETSVGFKESKIKWGEVKVRTSKQMKSGELMATDNGNRNDVTEDVHKSSLCDDSPLDDHQLSGNAFTVSTNRNLRKEYEDCSGSEVCRHYDSIVTNHSELGKNPPPKPTKLRIKSKKIFKDPESPSQLKFITPVDVPTSAGGDSMSESLPYVEDNLILGLAEEEDSCKLPSSTWRLQPDSNNKLRGAGYKGVKSNWSRTNPGSYGVDLRETATNTTDCNHDLGVDYPEAATDAMRRTRSMGLKATSHAEKSTKRTSDELVSEEWMMSSKMTIRSKSSRNRESIYYDDDQSSSAGRKKSHYTCNWLTLSRQEEGYRYIPQLGDEVVYLMQVNASHLS